MAQEMAQVRDRKDAADEVSAQSEDESQTISSQSSQSTVPEHEISIWSDEIEVQQQKRQTFNDAVDSITGGRYSPVRSSLNTSWDDISSTQQSYYLRKAKEAIATSLSVISPVQEDQLWNSLRKESLFGKECDDSSRRLRFDPSSGLIDVLIKAHDQSESWQTKTQILSLFANDFSRTELQQLVPGLSKWRIDQARRHATETGKGQLTLEKAIFHIKIDPVKVDHFINFISRPELLQDVAFGTKTLKLDSGERIIIPAVIRTLIPSRIIEQYTSYCNQQGVVPPSQRSLYRMLEICSASMQKSLKGLDNVTAEGTGAFDSISRMVETLVENGADRIMGQNSH
ncbi:hypothetical protein QZH41_005013 [Actinostola sp. cb2023]|nr:hypothetical protein QZH41_005013 [Actinostola sp. cb2023]